MAAEASKTTTSGKAVIVALEAKSVRVVKSRLEDRAPYVVDDAALCLESGMWVAKKMPACQATSP